MSNDAQPAPGSEDALLARARDGDEHAFGLLIEAHRAELHAHCYRMLGSVHDAEDALQNALLRAWRGLARFEGRSTLRSWLYRIATNACLDEVARRPKRILPLDYGPPGDPHAGLAEPLAESVWVEPYPDEGLAVADEAVAPEARYQRREAVELAFIAALQHLPARQRAALILRDVLGYSARETAEVLATSVPSVKGALQRARRTVEERLPAQTQQATLRSLGDKRVQELVSSYVEALEHDDIDAVVEMLTEDATIAMPPTPTWYSGRDEIARFYSIGPMSGAFRWRHVATHANGQLAIAGYTWREREHAYRPDALDILTFRGSRISAVTAYLGPNTFGLLALPEKLSR